ncbi:MAG: hypothetical protein H6606_06145 [Flavobacteriales bacterium]|nr:hypothetical protein [Flavobacteriales bacterium]
MILTCIYDPTLLVSIANVIVAIVTLLIAGRTLRLARTHHYKSLIYTQIAERARICNSYLDLRFPKGPEENPFILSGILSSLVVHKELLDLELSINSRKKLGLDEMKIKKSLLLQLHTTIREYIHDGEDKTQQIKDIAKKMEDAHINRLLSQYNTCREYFRGLHPPNH